MKLNEKVSKLDVQSWIFHNKAQTNLQNKIQYNKFYKDFIRVKSLVDKFLFKIDKKIAELSAAFLGEAAKKHDYAELYYDKGNINKSYFNWSLVLEKLQARYIIILIAYSVKNLNEIEVKSLKNLERIKRLLYKNTNNFLLNPITLIKLAYDLAYEETMQWKTHHIKDYESFILHTSNIFKILGCKSFIASRASKRLAEACKFHDEVERLQQFKSPIDLSSYWLRAIQNLNVHYEILLNKISKNKFIKNYL